MTDFKPHEALKEKALEIILNFKPDEKLDKNAVSEILKLKGQFKKAISFLSKEQQEVLELRYFDNLSAEKIAQATGKPKEKVTKLLLDGIEDLKSIIRKGTVETSSFPEIKQIPKLASFKEQQVQKEEDQNKSGFIAGFITISIFLTIFILFYFLGQKFVFNQMPSIPQVIEITSEIAQEKFPKNQNKKVQAPNKNSNDIKIAGSTSIFLLSRKWENAFNIEYPKYHLSIISSDSNKGIKDLIEDNVDIANSSRPITYSDKEKANENGVELIEHRVALDALVVIINKKNPINEISLDELKAILNYDAKNWSEVSENLFNRTISPIIREKGSGTNDFVANRILEGSDFSHSILRATSNEEIIKIVSENEEAISFINSNNYPWNNKNIKYLKIKTYNNSQSISPFEGAQLNEQAIRYGDYPLAHYLYLITSSNASNSTNEFVEWILGQKAQTIVRNSGLIPIREEEE